MKLNLGCGNHRMDDYIGVDYVKTDAVDVVADLSRAPWPFDDDSVDYAFSSHLVEHLPMREDIREDGFVVFINELHRVLKPGAQAEIRAPYGKSGRAFQDPTHRRFIVEATWYYANKAWRDANGLDHYPITANFDIVTVSLDGLSPVVATRHAEAQQRMVLTEWDAAADIVAILQKHADSATTM